jgi:hypothetical protein
MLRADRLARSTVVDSGRSFRGATALREECEQACQSQWENSVPPFPDSLIGITIQVLERALTHCL